MWRFGVALALLAVIGCSDPNVEYDQLKDETQCSKTIDLGAVLGHDGGAGGNHLWVNLSGKGRHPTSWKPALSVGFSNTKAAKTPLPKDTAKIDIGLFCQMNASVHDWSDHKDIMTTASDGLTLEDIISLVEGSPLKLDGQEIPLTGEQRDEIRQVVISARRAADSR